MVAVGDGPVPIVGAGAEEGIEAHRVVVEVVAHAGAVGAEQGREGSAP